MPTGMRIPTPPIPAGAKPLSNQVAGHVHGHGKMKLGLLESSTGDVLKPIQSPPRGERELEFFQRIFDPESTDSVLVNLRPLVPRYLGEFHDGDIKYLRMENVTAQFECPCIMDLKIGRITYDMEATAAKIERQKRKCKYAEQFGFQIVGQRTYKPKTGEYVTFDRPCGRTLTPGQIPQCFYSFFNGDYQLRTDAILEVIVQLTNIENWFLQQQRFQFIALSLFVVYEGALDTSVTSKIADVRLIDFAHVFPTTERDENFLYGLRQVKQQLESLLLQHTTIIST